MSKLKCEEKSCRHNNCKVCNKQCIVLDEDAVCCSFQLKNEFDNRFGYEMGNDMAPTYSDVETAINCNDETCFFNRDCFCRASDVKIDNDAWCDTYRRK